MWYILSYPIPLQGKVKQGESAAASATTAAEGALSTASATATKVEEQVDAVVAKLPTGGAAATATADAGAGDVSRALPGLGGGDGAASAADPYAQDPEDKKMFGTCKVPESCVIA